MSGKSAKVKVRAEKALSASSSEKVLSAVSVVAVSIDGGVDRDLLPAVHRDGREFLPGESHVARRSCQACKWDIDNDGQINPVDVGIVQSKFGCLVGSGDEWCDRSDVDKDCMVNPVDSGMVQAHFGQLCP